jgi:F420-dependent oxidoreductase-like protein
LNISISLGGALAALPVADQVTYVQEAERLGVHSAWTVEGWGRDAVTPLAYMAARTERIRLGTAIMQISARAPAMTALSLAALSNDRFILGLGNSGPQIVEGLHGASFALPLGRLRETVAVIRQAFAGEKLEYEGKHLRLPRPGGRGKAIRLSEPSNSRIPIYLATLGRNSLRFTGEAADGWIGTALTPEHADGLLDDLRAGAASVGRSMESFDIHVGAAAVCFDTNIEALVDAERMGRAFTLGGMGSAKTNFYADAYARGGWADAAREVQKLWLDGKREQAAKAVPAEMIINTNLFGDETMIRSRLAAYQRAGVTSLKVQPTGATVAEKLDTLERLMSLATSANNG